MNEKKRHQSFKADICKEKNCPDWNRCSLLNCLGRDDLCSQEELTEYERHGKGEADDINR